MISKFNSLLNDRGFVILLFLALLFGCAPDNEVSDTQFTDANKELTAKMNNVEQTFYGPTQPMGHGIIRSSVTMTKDGKPEQVAIVFSEKALNSLSTMPHTISLQLHQKAKHLTIDHIDVGWNPMGHEPDFLYAIPHFDIHFYWISPEEKMAINDGVLADILPSSEYVPMTYFDTPGFVPNMGKHWLSGLAEELIPGNVFTKTFIYGSYNGKFIFGEPMITRDYFLQKDFPESLPIYQPQQYQVPGYYPTSYSITFDEVKKLYSVSLDGFIWKD